MIQVEMDKRIRLTSAVMLLTKYVGENSNWKPHPLKVQTIEHLKGLEDHPCAAATRELAESFFMNSFHSYAIMMDWTPGRLGLREEFKEAMEEFEQHDYARLLDAFYHDAGLESLWDQTADQWDDCARDCRRILQDARIEEFYDLFFGPTDHPMVVVPNPTDPTSFGFGPSDCKTAYSLIGPPNVPPNSELPVTYAFDPDYIRNMAFHEFAHTLYWDLRQRCPELTEQTAHLHEKVKPIGWFSEMYDGWEIRLDEILIRSTTALYLDHIEGEASAQALLEKDRTQHGLDILIPVYSLLQEYLTARQHGDYTGFHEYVPTLCSRLSSL